MYFTAKETLITKFAFQHRNLFSRETLARTQFCFIVPTRPFKVTWGFKQKKRLSQHPVLNIEEVLTFSICFYPHCTYSAPTRHVFWTQILRSPGQTYVVPTTGRIPTHPRKIMAPQIVLELFCCMSSTLFLIHSLLSFSSSSIALSLCSLFSPPSSTGWKCEYRLHSD